jgi:signal transduction histidine kinase/ligand-binding sensor domain-containing protein
LKLFTTFLFTLLFCAGHAQEQFYEEWYSAELKNIPQNSIKSIAPDKYGFVWMTTENGLLRFDGKNFKVFNSVNANLLSNRFSYFIGNIQKDSLKTNTAFYTDKILINNRTVIKSRKSNRQKTFYTKETYEDLLYYNNIHNDPTIDFKYSKIKCENGYYYYVEGQRITLFNEKNKKIKEVKLDFKKNTLYFLHENELILLNYKENSYGLFENEFATSFALNLPKNSKIIYNHIVQQLFVYNDSDILLLNKIKNKIEFTSLFSKPKININIKSLYFDKKWNKLFIGSLDKGLNVISRKKFKTLINPLSANNNYYASFPISENEFITSKGEIFNEKGLLRDLKIKKLDKNYAIAVDRQKNIWITIENEIIKYLKSTNYETFKTYEFNNKIAPIYCDSKNRIWVGMAPDADKNARVYTIDANDAAAKPIALKNIRKPVDFFAENHKQEMLMVRENELLIYNVQNQVVKSVSSGSNEIRSLYIARDNSVWACTYNNGFSLFENNTFYKMPFDNQMYLLSAHCIKEDKMGRFWISTNKGLIQVTEESLLQYHKNKTPVYYHHYNIENGFLINEFNGGCQPCGIELKDQFIFPSLNGMVIFNPDEFRTTIPVNSFYINEAELDGKSRYFKDTLYIERSINRVKFKIDYAYFGNQDNVFFEVKLAIKESEKWVNLFNEKEIIYTNLPPGIHTFYVRKIKPFTSEYEIKKTIINIPFLFYEKLWFKFFIGILLVIIIALITQFRFALIREKNSALEKIVGERTSDLHDTVTSLEITKNNLKQEILQQKKLIGTISHDIKSPLKFLSITANHLYDKSLNFENEKMKNNAKVIQESASELYRFVENLVDYSKVFIAYNELNESTKENIDPIVHEKINLFKNLAAENNILISYKNLSPGEINLNKRVFGIIIHNLLDNAIKNTLQGSISIETKVMKNKIYVSITDTGAGMPEELKEYYINMQKNYETDKLAIQNYGLGLHMVLELLRLLKGDMKIYSGKNEGTEVTLIFDLH